MDAFFERLMTGAATIDELLSDDFETVAGGSGDVERAARRLDAWCRSSAAGDRSLFDRRLQRDALAPDQVLARLTAARRSASASPPAWVNDAIWIDEALRQPAKPWAAAEPCAFEQLLRPVVDQADAQLWSGISAKAAAHLSDAARAALICFLGTARKNPTH